MEYIGNFSHLITQAIFKTVYSGAARNAGLLNTWTAQTMTSNRSPTPVIGE